MTNVYFISGMGASCNVFDNIVLPSNYTKVYIEWISPEPNETLEHYTKRLMENIDQTQPFVLLGYSFGGIIVQEMNRYIHPLQTILLSSIKNYIQRPKSFSFFQTIKIEKLMRSWLFNEKLIAWILKFSVYKTKEKTDVKEILPQLNANYMRWAIKEILQWRPSLHIAELYQIHGTKDATFPYRKIKTNYPEGSERLFTIKDAGHLVALEKPTEVSSALKIILGKTD